MRQPNQELAMKKIVYLYAVFTVFCLALPPLIYSGISYPYSVPPLPYEYSDLEPHIDTRTMTVHHDKHHKAYVDKLNDAIKPYPELHKKTLAYLLKNLDKVPEAIRKTVRDNGGGHFNHSLFWRYMSPKAGGQPKGELLTAIQKTFGSFKSFQEQFDQAAKTVFGSGWAWLCLTKEKTLLITTTANQDTPFSDDMVPLLGLDVWEHAYYLKYTNQRVEYITAWWQVVNWPYVEKIFNIYNSSSSKNTLRNKL